MFRIQANLIFFSAQIFSSRLSALLIASDQVRFVCPLQT